MSTSAAERPNPGVTVVPAGTPGEPLRAYDGAGARPAEPPAPVVPGEPGVPVATELGGLLRRIAAKRAEAQSTFDIPVMGPLSDSIVVRFGLVDDKVAGPITDKAMAEPGGVTVATLNARLLAAFCVGVYFVADDGQLVSADLDNPALPAPRFDARLADALGIPFVNQQQVCQFLYSPKGDGEGWDGVVRSTYEALARRSGYGQAGAVEASIRGN